ncbi:MAG: polysaccharide deacetylase family protein [Chitinivibrionia bacterium]|nr:polysaccharide deacetylase family protein [Chitinivibrionia bacterium]
MNKLPILMYHRIESNECPVLDREEARYAVALEEFSWQLEFIDRSGLRCRTVSEAAEELRAGRIPQGSIVLTFDDGNRSDFVHALPLLAARGFRATFFITADSIGKPDGLDGAMIRALAGAGMEIGSHGMTHRFLTELPEQEQRVEIETSQRELSGAAGGRIRAFSPPGGRIDGRSAAIVRAASYESMCSSRFGFNGAGSDPFMLKRFPVTSGAARAAFAAIVRGDRLRLAPLYARACAVRCARGVLGERIYRRTRSKILGD